MQIKSIENGRKKKGKILGKSKNFHENDLCLNNPFASSFSFSFSFLFFWNSLNYFGREKDSLYFFSGVFEFHSSKVCRERKKIENYPGTSFMKTRISSNK